MPTPAASIIILTHDDVDYFEECLESVRARTEVPHEIIVVDNASQAAAVRRLERLCRRPNIRLIRNRENRFFAAGNNQGIRAARGRHLVLLNADAVVGTQWLTRLIAWADSDPSVGLVAPMTNSATGLQCVAAPPYRTLSDFPKFSWVWAQAHAGRSQEVHRLIAFCLLVKREVVERVGLLDERFGPGGYEITTSACASDRRATSSCWPKTSSCTITAPRATREWITPPSEDQPRGAGAEMVPVRVPRPRRRGRGKLGAAEEP